MAAAASAPGAGPSAGLTRRVRNLPPTSDPSIIANRQRWVDFVSHDLGQALGEYHGATTVAQRQDGLKRVHDALRSLQTHNQDRPWQPAWELQTAVNDLFNQPNLDITADINVVQPVFDQNLVTIRPGLSQGLLVAGDRRAQDGLRPAAQR